MRYRLRTLLIVLALALPVLVLGVALGVALLAVGMPFSKQRAVCWECGMARETHETWGRTTKDQITQNEISQWAASKVPEGHVHVWSITDYYGRKEWFGNAPIVCGFRFQGEGAVAAWHLANFGEQAAAEQAYQEYQDILNGKSPKTIAVHRKEMEDAINRRFSTTNGTP